jgi:hypothetical protein
VLDAVDGHFQLQILEALVCLDVSKHLLEGRFGGIGRERFEDGIWAGLANSGDDIVEGVGATGKKSDGKVAVGSMGEDACNASALICHYQYVSLCVRYDVETNSVWTGSNKNGKT